MEMASFLAGERWSDHPACVHPLLAAVARMVNDALADSERNRLTLMIPDVIGLNSTDVRVDARLSLCCARAALPIACEPRQRALAVGVLASERVLAIREGRPGDALTASSQELLGRVPSAAQWAQKFAGRSRISARDFRHVSAPRIAGLAVLGIAEAAVPDADNRLVDLLVACIAETRSLVPSARSGSGTVAGAAAQRLETADLS